MGRTGRWVTLFVLLLAVAAGVAASPVQASKEIRYGIQDDAWLESGPGSLDQRLATFKRLGVPLVRFTLRWNDIARRRPANPTSPRDRAYDWRRPDRVLAGLRRHGLTPVLTLVGTPAWANGGRSPAYAPPRPRDFRDFARAAAKRYPWVRYWLIWNEPNKRLWLRPTKPKIYVRHLLNPGYEGIHCRAAARSGRRRRDRASWRVGRRRTHHLGPRHGCRPREARRLRPPPVSLDADRDAVQRRLPHAALRSRWRRSGSSSPSSSAPSGRSRSGSPSTATSRIRRTRSWAFRSRRQASMVSLAAMRAWRLPRVTMLFQYLYRDEVVLSRFQTGLVFANDRPKPSLQGFKLPFAQMQRHGLADGRLGSDPQRTARAEAVPAGGAPQERVEGGRARPADGRRRRLQPDDSPQARRAASGSGRRASGASACSCGSGSGRAARTATPARRRRCPCLDRVPSRSRRARCSA